MSTTNKVKNALYTILEQNEGGLTAKQVWEELEKDPKLKEELYNKGKRRDGVLVGLTSRIKDNKVEGIKVVKNSDNQLIYIKTSSDLDYLTKVINDFLQNVNSIKLKKENLDSDTISALSETEKVLSKLAQCNNILKDNVAEQLKNSLVPNPKPKETVKEKVEPKTSEPVIDPAKESTVKIPAKDKAKATTDLKVPMLEKVENAKKPNNTAKK